MALPSRSRPPGVIRGLLGPNGAGKSTTLKILTTLSRPTSGTALVLGFDVLRRSLEVRRRIASVIQETAVDLLLGNGATLEWTGNGNSRLFAVGSASIIDTLDNKTVSGTGALRLEAVYIKGLKIKGGDGAYACEKDDSTVISTRELRDTVLDCHSRRLATYDRAPLPLGVADCPGIAIVCDRRVVYQAQAGSD